jgi:hypothetical protein
MTLSGQNAPVLEGTPSAAGSPPASGVVRRMYPVVRRFAPWIVGISLSMLLAFIACNSLNYISGRHPFVDSGIYSGCALHLKAGKALYREVFESKGPVIFILNWLALSLGEETIQSIHIMERVFAIVATLLIFGIFRAVFSSWALAFIFALFLPFFLYNPKVHEGGNLTEEYAVVFVLAMVLLVIVARNMRRSWSLSLTALAGAFGALAVLTKDPFIFSSVAWFAYVAVNRTKCDITRCARITAFILGAMLPALALLVWLTATGAVSDWIDVFSYNKNFAATQPREGTLYEAVRNNYYAMNTYSDLPIMTRLLMILGLVSAFSSPFRRLSGNLPVFAAMALGFEFVGTMVSAFHLPHYYMQMAPSYCIVSACGGAFLGYALQAVAIRRSVTAGMVMILFLMFDAKACVDFVARLKIKNAEPRPTPIVEYIRAHAKANDTLWIGSAFNSRFYLETGLLSPTKFFYILDWPLLSTRAATSQQKQETLLAELWKRPPRFILENSDAIHLFDKTQTRKWITEHYAIADVREGSVSLYVYDNGFQYEYDEKQKSKWLSALSRTQLSPELAEVDAAMDQMVTIKLENLPIRDAIMAVARSVNLSVDLSSILDSSLKANEAICELSFIHVMETLLRPARLDFEPIPGGIRVIKGDEGVTSMSTVPRHRISYCLDLDGRQGGVTIPYNRQMNVQESFTAEAWVFFRAPSPLAAGIISRDVPQSGPFLLDVTQDGRVFANVSSGNWADQPLDIKWPQLPRNRWVHVALVYGNNEVCLYLDGKPEVHFRGPDNVAITTCPLVIGRKPYNGSTFNGKIDEVRISSIARYKEPFKPATRFQPDVSTIGLYHCDSKNGAIAEDASGRGLNGELKNVHYVPK